MKSDFYNYFIDANKYKPISPQREIELAPLIRQGNIQAMHELVTANLKIVGLVVRKNYLFSNIEYQDALGAGYLGLVEAARKFDGTRGFKFYTYAQSWIHKEIKLAIIENDTYRIPANRRSRLNVYDHILRKLTQELNREPTIEEIAIRMDEETKQKITPNKIKETIRDLGAIYHKSIDAPLNRSTTTTFKETCQDIPLENIAQQIQQILNNSKITSREKRMLELRFFKKYTFAKIGTIFNHSDVWTQVLIKRTLAKLEKSPTVKNIFLSD